jgi:F-type H+-transporting ATPase subunit b
VAVQAGQIVKAAHHEAALAAENAKQEIRRSADRRLATATEQNEAAEQAAVRQIKDRAVAVAVAAAGDVIRQRMGKGEADKLIDASIADVGAKLH